MAEDLLMWPEASYLVNHEHKFVYCPIMKVASTPLKINCMKMAGISFTDATWGTADAPLRFERTKPQEACRILQGSEYFKFAFVRNPYSRLVSAFLGVFAQNHISELGIKTIIEVKKRFNLPPVDDKKRITFRHFVKYVCLSEKLDAHWNPQCHFIGNRTKFDFIGKIENMPSDLEYINHKVGPIFDIGSGDGVGYANKTDTGSSNNLSLYDNCYCDELMLLKERLGGYPSYKHFYPADLKEFVSIRYRKDFEMFGYGF